MAESGNKEKCNICLEVGISYNGLSNNDPNFDGWKRIVIRDACIMLHHVGVRRKFLKLEIPSIVKTPCFNLLQDDRYLLHKCLKLAEKCLISI